MTRRIVVVGGGAAGMGAAGGIKAVDPGCEVTVYTGFDDVAYSPCGIPYVHGKEIDSFERLFLASKQAYVDAGIDVHYNAEVTKVDVSRKVVDVAGEGGVSWDTLVLATGFNYADPGVPGGDLGGLYYVKNIREAIEWDKVLDTVKSAVVIEASPLGVEMVTALAHRGIETHLVDPSPWPMSEVADPDIMEPVEESWRELGVITHFNTTLEAFVGDDSVQAVQTSDGEIKADLVVVCTHKEPNNALGVVGRPQDRLHRWFHRRRADGDLRAGGVRGRRLHRDPERADRRAAPGTHGQPRLRAGQDCGHQRRRWLTGLQRRLRALGYGGGQVDHRRRVTR